MTRASLVKEKHNNYPVLPTTSTTFLNNVAGKQVSLSLVLLSARKILSTAAYPRCSFITEFLANLFEFANRPHQSFKGAFKVLAEVKPVFVFDV